MHWSILIVISLSLGCSKKQAAAPPTLDDGTGTESRGASDVDQPKLGVPEDPSSEVPRPQGSPELPPELRTPAPPLDAPPVLEVMELGDEPRRTPRWLLEPGLDQKLSLDVGFSLDALVVVLRVAEPIYVVSYDLTLRAGKLQRDGSIRVTFSVDKASMDTTQLAETRVDRMERALTAARKITGSYTLGPAGHLTNLETKLPADATRTSHDMADNLAWALGQMIPVFPEEPVGRGAKWQVNQGVRQRGAHVNQLRTIELIEVDGERLRLSIKLQQSAAKQAFQDPGLPLTHKLTLLNGTGDGSLDWNLTELAPRAADVTSTVLRAVKHPSSEPGQNPVVVIAQSQRALKVGQR